MIQQGQRRNATVSTRKRPQNETGYVVMLRSGACEPVGGFHQALEYFSGSSTRVAVKHG